MLFLAVLSKLITHVVIATSQAHPFQVFTATFLWCSLPNQVRAAAKITAGGLKIPANFTPCELRF